MSIPNHHFNSSIRIDYCCSQPTSTDTSSLSSSGNPVNRTELNSEMWEFEERRKCKQSIIVKGTDANDIGSFCQVFGDVTQQLLIDARFVPDYIVRVIGDDASHPVHRVKFFDQDTRNQLLTRANQVKDSDLFKDVDVSTDLT